MDMHSGGSLKEDKQYIYIEAPKEEAKVIFYNIYWHNPERVTCTCCWDDYSINESEDLIQATGYERGCDFDSKTKKYIESETGDSRRTYQSLDEYLKSNTIVVHYAKDIKPERREWDVPEQWYVRQ